MNIAVTTTVNTMNGFKCLVMLHVNKCIGLKEAEGSVQVLLLKALKT